MPNDHTRGRPSLEPSLDGAASTVASLVATFAANSDYYLSPEYQEAEVRKDFIDKFLQALGWDVNHEIQTNPFQQEVKVERAVQTATAQRRADYSISLPPHFDSPVLYVEAKKPTNALGTPDNCFQIIRYGNQRNHAIGVLTDFAELIVVDSRYKANIDAASSRILRRYSHLDLANTDKFAEVFFLISRPAVLGGSLERFAASLPKPRGRPGQKSFLPVAYRPLDERLLEMLDSARESLARGLKNGNPRLESVALTELTQRIIDRLVFIRFLEDKLIEPDPIIPRLGNVTDRSAWQDFLQVSRRLDRIYNGIVFKYHDLLDAPGLLSMDDKIFADVLSAFDFHESEYLFNEIPLHILGSIYERFLGNVIVATGKRASLKPKPEARKAGGVYYTPKYIVDYIVGNAVRPAIDRKSPRELRSMRFADISCGSGSFLLGIYECLLQHLSSWYNANPSKAPKSAVVKRDGALHLSLEEKARILVEHIYGVDIDPQAVEVAQLSLYLKLLEEETTASARQYTLSFHRPLLPSLANNIKCGNSIIDSKFFNSTRTLFPDTDMARRVNPLDWKDEFPAAIQSGGFDAIVGNPPYVSAWELFENVPEIRDYLNSDTSYATADRHWDLYVLFIERALQLLRPGGRLAFIIPYSYAIQKYGMKSRRLVLEQTTIESIADLRTVRVFPGVPVITMIPVFRAEKPDRKNAIRIRLPGADATKKHAGTITDAHTVSQSGLLELDEAMLRLDLSDSVRGLCDRIAKSSLPLGSICHVSYGAQMSSAVRGRFGKDHVLRDAAASPTCRRTVSGRDLYRYRVTWGGKWVEWGLADEMYGAREAGFFEERKLMIRDITGTHRLETTLDDTKLYCDHTILCALRACDALKFRKMKPDMVELSKGYSLELLQGLVASKLTSAFYYWRLTGEGVRTGGGFHTYPKTIRALPIFDKTTCSPAKRSACKEIEVLVPQLLALSHDQPEMVAEHSRTVRSRQGDAIDRRIDSLVYQLYDLSDEEIQLVEDATT